MPDSRDQLLDSPSRRPVLPSFAMLEPVEKQSDLGSALLNVAVTLFAFPVLLFLAFLIGRAMAPAPARPVVAGSASQVKPDIVYAGLPAPTAASKEAHATPANDIVYFAPMGSALPELLSTSTPKYTKEALARHCEGAVRLNVKIDTEGRTGNPAILRGLGCGLDDQALRAVMNWRFQPGRQGGKAIPVVAWVEVHFDLP